MRIIRIEVGCFHGKVGPSPAFQPSARWSVCNTIRAGDSFGMQASRQKEIKLQTVADSGAGPTTPSEITSPYHDPDSGQPWATPEVPYTSQNVYRDEALTVRALQGIDDLPDAVSLSQHAGPMSFQVSYTPNQARLLARALLVAAQLIEDQQ